MSKCVVRPDEPSDRKRLQSALARIENRSIHHLHTRLNPRPAQIIAPVDRRLSGTSPLNLLSSRAGPGLIHCSEKSAFRRRPQHHRHAALDQPHVAAFHPHHIRAPAATPRIHTSRPWSSAPCPWFRFPARCRRLSPPPRPCRPHPATCLEWCRCSDFPKFRPAPTTNPRARTTVTTAKSTSRNRPRTTSQRRINERTRNQHVRAIEQNATLLGAEP